MPGFVQGIHGFFVWQWEYRELAARGAVHRYRSLDKSSCRNYLYAMNIIRRTLEIDAGTDARLTEMAAERGQDVAAVLAEAITLLDSVVDLAGPDIGEDRRRLDEFLDSRKAVPLDSVKAWVASWDTAEETPRPSPHEIG
jgi:predicted transcriptional regulator